MQDFERNLGYVFKDRARLLHALSHSSAGQPSNERLEFLGDSILNFVAAEMLYDRYPRLPEGELSRLRAGMICEDALAKLATRLGLPSVLRYTNDGFRPIRLAPIAADAMEAVFAAIYQDGGLVMARQVIQRHLTDMMQNGEARIRKDPKTALQEYLQGKGFSLPVYTPVSVKGQVDDENRFEVSCHASALALTTKGHGRTRKAAEAAAASAMLAACSQRA